MHAVCAEYNEKREQRNSMFDASLALCAQRKRKERRCVCMCAVGAKKCMYACCVRAESHKKEASEVLCGAVCAIEKDVWLKAEV